MPTFDYQTYLASREWALKREAVRERCENICERCHRAPHQQTHHLTYARVGSEPLEDLLGVCKGCHEFLSGKSDVDPLLQPRSIRLSSNIGRDSRLERVAQRLAITLTTWWPTNLHQHKGDLTVFATSCPTHRDVQVVAAAWEEEFEYNIEFVVNGRLFENGALVSPAPSWVIQASECGEVFWAGKIDHDSTRVPGWTCKYCGARFKQQPGSDACCLAHFLRPKDEVNR